MEASEFIDALSEHIAAHHKRLSTNGQGKVLVEEHAKDFACTVINKIADLSLQIENGAVWLEILKEASSPQSRKRKLNSLNNGVDQLRAYLRENFKGIYEEEKLKKDPPQIAVELLKKIDEPIKETMAFNISRSFMKAISSELKGGIPQEEQKIIARRTTRPIQKLLTLTNRIHFTGKRKD